MIARKADFIRRTGFTQNRTKNIFIDLKISVFYVIHLLFSDFRTKKKNNPFFMFVGTVMKEHAKTNQTFCMLGQEMLHPPGYPKVSCL